MNSLALYIDDGTKHWTKKPKMLPSEYAVAHRRLSPEYTDSDMIGDYDLGFVPYAKEPMDECVNPRVRKVILQWAAGTTKTTVLENIAIYFIGQEPSPILMVQETVDMAQSWSKERLACIIRDSRGLPELVDESKSRDSGNTIQFKNFPGGNIAIVGANAPGGLRMRRRRVVLCDEVDAYPPSAGTEGDPVSLAMRRTEGFRNPVIVLSSTPTVKGESRIERLMEGTDRRMWFVPCPLCGQFQVLEFTQIKWGKRRLEAAGLPTDGARTDGSDAVYECAHCRRHWNDIQRVAAVQDKRSHYRPTAPFVGDAGFIIDGYYTPFATAKGYASRMHKLAADFMEASAGGPETLKVYVNTVMNRLWEGGEKLKPSDIEKRAESYGPDSVPNEVVLVTVSGDVQNDRIEIEFVGVGEDEQSWGIKFEVIEGDTLRPATWARLSDAIQQTFTRQDGTKLKAAAMAIDIGHYPKEVLKWCRSHGTSVQVYPVFGIASDKQPQMVTARTDKRTRMRTYSVVTDQCKDTIYSRLRMTEPGPRYIHIPKGHGYSQEWFAQLTIERKETKYVKGYSRRMYVKPNNARNEAIDIRVYWLACLEILNPNLKVIAQRMRPVKQNPVPQPGAQEQPKAQSRARFAISGIVGGWKI